MQDNDTLITDTRAVLIQGIELIESLDDALYTRLHHPALPYGIGSHFRHCIDFYHCFFSALASGHINYDHRERDGRVETDRRLVIAKLRAIVVRLDELLTVDERREVEVISEDSGDSPRASRSTVRRELQFLLSHTIHHYAIISLALRFQGIEVQSPFGVALSTLKHWEKEKAEYSSVTG